jgi:chaperonin GroES
VIFRVQLNSGTVIEIGPGVKNKEGNVVPLDVKKGDTVLLPEYGGSHVKLAGKE